MLEPGWDQVGVRLGLGWDKDRPGWDQALNTLNASTSVQIDQVEMLLAHHFMNFLECNIM